MEGEKRRLRKKTDCHREKEATLWDCILKDGLVYEPDDFHAVSFLVYFCQDSITLLTMEFIKAIVSIIYAYS